MLVLLSFVSFFAIRSFGTTLSFGKKEAYRIMKKNIISVSYDYINECDSGTISCDFSHESQFQFSAEVLRENGYFKSLKSPIDGKDLGECLLINVTKENGTIFSELIDNCY